MVKFVLIDFRQSFINYLVSAESDEFKEGERQRKETQESTEKNYKAIIEKT